jgi:hypothetical protein
MKPITKCFHHLLKGNTPTRQTSTSRINRKCLSCLMQQVVVLLISSQIKILKRCLVDVLLMAIIFNLILVSQI